MSFPRVAVPTTAATLGDALVLTKESREAFLRAISIAAGRPLTGAEKTALVTLADGLV